MDVEGEEAERDDDADGGETRHDDVEVDADANVAYGHYLHGLVRGDLIHVTCVTVWSRKRKTVKWTLRSIMVTI